MESSSSSSSSLTSSLHLAMAALVEASIMAISAFYIHKRSIDQVLNRLTELRRDGHNRFSNERLDKEEEEDEGNEKLDDEVKFGSDGEMGLDRKIWGRSLSRSVDEKFLRYYRMSSSLPNVALGNSDWVQENANFRAQGFSSSLDKLNHIPLGLSPLRTDQRHGNLFFFFFCV